MSLFLLISISLLGFLEKKVMGYGGNWWRRRSWVMEKNVYFSKNLILNFKFISCFYLHSFLLCVDIIHYNGWPLA